MNPESSPIRRALVTGATGFIGRHLCQRLQEQGIFVRALSRHQSTGPWDDQVVAVLGEDEVKSHWVDDIDTVIHLAGHAHALDEIDSAKTHQQVTVTGTRQLLSLLDSGVHRLLYVSSVKALPIAPAKEPDSDYGRAKSMAEQLVQEFHSQGGMRTIILRLPLVYGPNVKGNLRNMLGSVARGRFPPLPEFGNRRSMIHVDDVCVAIIQALQKATSGSTFILTDGHKYSSREIYLAMRSALGQPPPRWCTPVFIFKILAIVGDAAGTLLERRPGFDSQALDKLAGNAWYDNSPAMTDFGFQPRHSLSSALPDMLAAWRRDQMK